MEVIRQPGVTPAARKCVLRRPQSCKSAVAPQRMMEWYVPSAKMRASHYHIEPPAAGAVFCGLKLVKSEHDLRPRFVSSI